MAKIAILAALLALAVSQPAAADDVAQWQPLIKQAAQRFAIPESWIVGVMHAESRGHTELAGRPIRSPRGAMGLMQLMPATWRSMRAAYGLGRDPDDPRDNILAGAAYLRLMYDRFGYPGLFGAYNAGPGRYAAYLAGRERLPGETIAYLGGVAGRGNAAPITAAMPPGQMLFVLRRDLAEGAPSSAEPPAEAGLFAVRKGNP